MILRCSSVALFLLATCLDYQAEAQATIRCGNTSCFTEYGVCNTNTSIPVCKCNKTLQYTGDDCSFRYNIMVDGDYTLYNQSTLDGRQNVRSFLVNLTALIEVDEKSIQVMQIEPGVGMQLSLGTWSAGEIDRRLIANDVNITELGVLQSKRVLYDNDTARVLNGNSDVADMVTRLCDPNPCGKNGKCKIDTELYEWECACKAPWTGDLCDITLKLEVLEPFTTFDPVKFQKSLSNALSVEDNEVNVRERDDKVPGLSVAVELSLASEAADEVYAQIANGTQAMVDLSIRKANHTNDTVYNKGIDDICTFAEPCFQHGVCELDGPNLYSCECFSSVDEDEPLFTGDNCAFTYTLFVDESFSKRGEGYEYDPLMFENELGVAIDRQGMDDITVISEVSRLPYIQLELSTSTAETLSDQIALGSLDITILGIISAEQASDIAGVPSVVFYNGALGDNGSDDADNPDTAEEPESDSDQSDNSTDSSVQQSDAMDTWVIVLLAVGTTMVVLFVCAGLFLWYRRKWYGKATRPARISSSLPRNVNGSSFTPEAARMTHMSSTHSDRNPSLVVSVTDAKRLENHPKVKHTIASEPTDEPRLSNHSAARPLPPMSPWMNTATPSKPQAVEVREIMRTREGPIPDNSLVRHEKLGIGQFGLVYRGDLIIREKVCPVAIKELKICRPEYRAQFVAEAELMKKLEHVNIVTCVGIATGPPLAIVMELMTMGDLYTYLRSQDERECYVTDAQRLYTIYQVARAMHYLSNHGVVHRDLAARNCMMSPPRAGTFGFPIVRVSDFGLSREISDTENYYKMQSHDKLPIHWMAVEAIVDRKFSVASDVWSFAVVAWEVFGDACAKPHQNLNVFQMLEYYKSGKRLLQPAKCPDLAYRDMLNCWDLTPSNRPSFGDLSAVFAHYFKECSPVDVVIRRDNQGEIQVIRAGSSPAPTRVAVCDDYEIIPGSIEDINDLNNNNNTSSDTHDMSDLQSLPSFQLNMLPRATDGFKGNSQALAIPGLRVVDTSSAVNSPSMGTLRTHKLTDLTGDGAADDRPYRSLDDVLVHIADKSSRDHILSHITDRDLEADDESDDPMMCDERSGSADTRGYASGTALSQDEGMGKITQTMSNGKGTHGDDSYASHVEAGNRDSGISAQQGC